MATPIFLPAWQVAQQQGVKCLTYSRAGMGKTYMIRTAPRPCVISAEAGILCLADTAIPVAQVRTMKDFMDCYEWAAMSAEAKNFDTICIDSASEIAEKLLAVEKKGTKDPRQAYTSTQDQIEAVIRMFRDLPQKHVYITAKLSQRKDAAVASGAAAVGPMMPGQGLSLNAGYFFDEVFLLGIAQVPNTAPPVTYRYLQTQPDAMNEAKDRSGRLDAMEEPHLGKIFAKIMAPPAV